MIRATVTPIKLGQYIFTFDGLTTKGHNYLAVANTPKAWRNLKKHLMKQGFHLHHQALANLLENYFRKLYKLSLFLY